MKKVTVSGLLYLLFWIPVAGSSLSYPDLEIGDPTVQELYVDLTLDAITDAKTGELLTPREFALRMNDTSILLLGETHNSHLSHQAQLRIIKALHEANREIVLGLEMFPKAQQIHLDRWVDGLYTEKGFVELSDWYEHWGYNWNYYREIFLYASEKKIPLLGINTDRALISAVSSKGLDGLSPEEKKNLPTVDTDSEDHRTLFWSYFSEGDTTHLTEDQDRRERIFQAQCTWDAVMASNVTKEIDARSDDPRTIIVVLAGTGHVGYGLGITRQLSEDLAKTTTSLIPLSLDSIHSASTNQIRASYADFFWGLEAENRPLFPSMGISTFLDSETEQLKIMYVTPHSPADLSGLQVDDLLISFDGVGIKDQKTLRNMIATKKWGDDADLTIKREGNEMELMLYFRQVKIPPETGPSEETPGR